MTETLAFLQAGGSVGALMRAHDWTASPLGPPTRWPQSLRSVVGLLLTSKFPMFVAWGEELGFLYNDAYAEILGDKHPKALGARFKDIWAEIWPDLEPLIDAALRGEALYRENLPLLMNRRGFQEQAWFTFSYSPVRDERGDVAGMFCAVSETTSQVLTQARQAFRLALEERLHRLDDPQAVMSAASEALGRELGVARVGYGEIDESEAFVVIERDWTDGRVSSIAGRHRLEDFGPPIIAELKAGRTLAVDDVVNDARVAALASSFAAIQTRSVLAVPLIKSGRFTAVLYLHHPEARRWREADKLLVEEVADRTWAAVERARAEASRRKSEERFRALATAGTSSLYRMSPDWSQMWQLDGKGFLTDTKVPSEAWLEKYIHPDDRPRLREAFAEAIRRKSLFELQHQVRRADGSLGWTHSRAVPILRDDGSIEEWFGVAQDVTAHRRAEQRLRESEEQFRALVENLPTLAWSAQPDGHIDYYNRRWYEYTGTSFEEMQGWGWEKVHDPDVLPKVIERWKHSLATGEPFEMEFPLRGADGVFRWFLTRVQPVRSVSGEVVRWFGTNTNVDEQRRQAAALKEAVEVRDTFLSVASHELKTPLTPMALRLQGITRVLAQQPDSPFVQQVRVYTQGAKRQIDKLAALVNDLLDVSRITSGRFRMELEPTDLALIARDVVTRFEPEAERAGSSLELKAPLSLPARTARLRIEQVFTNLVDNAIKYGAGKPVFIVLEAHGERARFAVHDQGIGIPPEHHARIFERFERAVSERNYGGLGLGLYISRTIVETLGGAIRVRSEPGKGATFTVEVPLQQGAARQPPAAHKMALSLANFFDIALAEAEALLERIASGEGWQPGPAQGTWLMPLQAGASTGAVKAFLVRIEKGVTYPEHTHEGDEHLHILQGGLLEPDGTELGPGRRVVNAQGGTHWSRALEDEDCLLAAMQMAPRPR
jgi:PAS domain S-box-containing protein